MIVSHFKLHEHAVPTAGNKRIPQRLISGSHRTVNWSWWLKLQANSRHVHSTETQSYQFIYITFHVNGKLDTSWYLICSFPWDRKGFQWPHFFHIATTTHQSQWNVNMWITLLSDVTNHHVIEILFQRDLAWTAECLS